MNIINFPAPRLPFGKQPQKSPVKSLDEVLAPPPKPALPPPLNGHPLSDRIIFMHIGDKPKPSAPAPEPVNATLAAGQAALTSLFPWMPSMQIKAVREMMKGEEGQFFIDKMIELATQIKEMPKTYAQDGLGDEAIAHLHYFIGGCDWYITEKDKGDLDDTPADFQRQAFGYACLGDPSCAELGYISIREIVSAGAELDFHFTPTTIGKIKAKIHGTEESEEKETLGKKQQRFLEMPDGYQEGAIIDSSWGYDQTNIDFYRIVKRSGDFVTLMPIRSTLTESSHAAMSGHRVPTETDKDPRTDHDVAWSDREKAKQTPTFRRKLRIHNGKVSGCTIVHGWADLWNGKPVGCSWYA